MATRQEELELTKQLNQVMGDFFGLSQEEITKIINEKNNYIKNNYVDIIINDIVKDLSKDIIKEKFITQNNSIIRFSSDIIDNKTNGKIPTDILKLIKEISLLEKYSRFIETELKTIDGRVNKLRRFLEDFNRPINDNKNILDYKTASLIRDGVEKFVEGIMLEIRNQEESKKPLLQKNTKFRDFSNSMDKYVFESKINPLVVIREQGEKTYYQTLGDKIKAISTIDFEKDLVLFIWGGQWSSDVFQLKKGDFQKLGYL